MARLEEITRGTKLTGVTADGPVTVVDVVWHGADVIELTYKIGRGTAANTLLFRDAESRLSISAKASNWSFSADGALLRLVSEARRIRLVHLFDLHLAVHTSLIEPLPHQITAVYGEMLVRQPLRFLLADDPGAGKTIMAQNGLPTRSITNIFRLGKIVEHWDVLQAIPESRPMTIQCSDS